jgi:hypothetical protein
MSLEMKKRICTLFLAVFVAFCFKTANGQVEHNYLVGPQSTDCDSLDISLLSLEDAISTIEKGKFRFQQQFKISRIYGVMNARYYSCDGEFGYLIMMIDKKDYIYISVPKHVWDKLIASSNINGFYASEIKQNYEVIED